MLKFNSFAAVFKEAAKGRYFESSGSEYSSESSTYLSDLVNSFERDIYVEDLRFTEEVEDEQENGGDQSKGFDNDKDCLKRLFNIGDDDVKRKIHAEVEKACYEDGSFSYTCGKRGLMTQLRYRGLNAGLCKTKWEKKGGCPSGVYEYIDVKFNGVRYIVEVSLTGEFEIARSTSNYTLLMEDFPEIYVGKVEDLKKIVKLMCKAIRTSMKSVNIHVPPWRKLAYMQAKWFGSYKRTINQLSTQKPMDDNNMEFAMKRLVGFVPVPAMSYYCEEFFVRKVSVN